MEKTIDERDRLIDLIRDINTLHKNQSTEWFDGVENVYNLKRKLIRDIFLDREDSDQQEAKSISTDFLKYLNSYCENLNKILSAPEYDFLAPELLTSTRIKDPDSRVAKLMHYMNSKSEQGKVGINKCLNDLLGFRVWLNDFEHGAFSCSILKEDLKSLGINVRVHDSCKENYLATHIYFSNENNKFFPWELQIWNYKDHESNISSHSDHKQGYTKWVKEYKQ